LLEQKSTTNSNGRSGTVAQWSSAVSQRWNITSDGDLVETVSKTGSAAVLRLKNNVSGSAWSYNGDNTIGVYLTASEHGFETTKQYATVTLNVAINNAPDIVFTDNSTNQNSNLAISGKYNGYSIVLRHRGRCFESSIVYTHRS